MGHLYRDFAYHLIQTSPFKLRDLSLYSTATQNSGVGGWRWAITPDARILRWDTNMLVSERTQKMKFASLLTQKKNCVSPDAKPQRQPVEYRLRWVPGVGSLHWACTFHIFCVDFICVGHLTQTRFSVEYGF